MGGIKIKQSNQTRVSGRQGSIGRSLLSQTAYATIGALL